MNDEDDEIGVNGIYSIYGTINNTLQIHLTLHESPENKILRIDLGKWNLVTIERMVFISGLEYKKGSLGENIVIIVSCYSIEDINKTIKCVEMLEKYKCEWHYDVEMYKEFFG